MTDFDHATEADNDRAKLAAQQAGWSQHGFLFVHPTTRRTYHVKDMDGWIDLCDNEAIEWDAH